MISQHSTFHPSVWQHVWQGDSNVHILDLFLDLAHLPPPLLTPCYLSKASPWEVPKPAIQIGQKHVQQNGGKARPLTVGNCLFLESAWVGLGKKETFWLFVQRFVSRGTGRKVRLDRLRLSGGRFSGVGMHQRVMRLKCLWRMYLEADIQSYC